MEPPSASPNPETARQRFSVLMREHHRELLLFAGAATRDGEAARDIVQESFVTAWRKFETFDADRDFCAWMRGIVRNKTKDWFRKQQRQPFPESDWIDLEVDIASWQSSRAQGLSIFEAVDHCIEELPDHFQSAVRKFYFEDQESAAAAADLSISPANLRKRLERARSLLHECLSVRLERPSKPQPSQAHA